MLSYTLPLRPIPIKLHVKSHTTIPNVLYAIYKLKCIMILQTCQQDFF